MNSYNDLTNERIHQNSSPLRTSLCVDHLEIQSHRKNGCIVSAGFSARACATCMASASMLTNHSEGWDLKTTQLLTAQFEQTLRAPLQAPWPERLQAFRYFEHLRAEPEHRDCALLPWRELIRSLRS